MITGNFICQDSVNAGMCSVPQGQDDNKTDLQIGLDDIYDENDKNGYK